MFGYPPCVRLKGSELCLARKTSTDDLYVSHKTEDFNLYYTIDTTPDGKQVELGKSGTFGTAYRVTEKETKKKFAMKVILKDKFRKEFESFKQEFQIIEELNHPNIIKGYDLFEDKKCLRMIMELCEGSDLYERICNRLVKLEKVWPHVFPGSNGL